MASRAQRKRRRRRDEESGGRRHQYDNEGLEPDEPDGRRHRDHEPYSRPRDEPEYPGAQVHRPTPREQNAHRYDDRNFRPDDREHPRRHHDDERRRPRHPDSDKRRPREDEPHFRPDGRPAHPRGYDDDDTQRHRYREDPAPYARGHEDTSRRPKHPDSAQESPGEDDAYVTLKDNSERPRRDRRDRNRLTQPDSDTHQYGAGDAHVTPDDHSPHSRRDHPHVHQPTQPYAGRQNFEKAAAAFGSGDPYADFRAKVHESRRKKPESQAKRGTGGGDVPYAYTPPVQPLGTSRHDRATVEEPLPFYSRPTGDEEQPNTPYKNDDDNDDEPSSSNVTVDIEMVEMRHPITSPHPRYQKNPSAQSAVQPTRRDERANAAYSTYSIKSWSELDNEISEVKKDLNKITMRSMRANAAYSTYSTKSWSELDDEISEVKKDLNKTFKPIFDQHGEEGMLLKKLRKELNRHHTQHLLNRDSIAQILNYADRDGDKYLSYAGFVSMVVKDLQAEKKMAFRGMLLSVIGSIGVLPKEKRDNFLASHKLCPPPLFIPIITLIQVIIFAVYVADMEDRGLEVTASSGYPFYSPLPYMPARRWQAWRFFTYMFIHDGYLHILYNVIAQLLFGFPLEVVHGWWRTAIIYLTGVAAGSLAHSVLDPGVGLVGASGGVYAIMGAHLAAVVTNWKEMNYKLCDQEEFESRVCCAVSRLLVSAPFRMVLVVLLVLPDTGLAIFRRVALDEDLKVGISAHVGGFLTGLFLGIPVLKNVNKHAWETNLGWITLAVFLLISAFAVFFNAFFDERYPPTDWS